MKTTIRFLLLLVAATVVAWLLHSNQGSVAVITGDTLWRTSLSVFVVAVLVLFVVFYLLLRLLTHILGAPASIQRWRLHRRELREDRMLERSLLQSVQGNYPEAKKAFARFIKYTRSASRQVLASLQMATNANQAEQYQERDHYIQEALRAAQTDRKLMDQVERVRIDQLLMAGQAKQALPLIQARYGLEPSQTEEGQDRQLRLYELLFQQQQLSPQLCREYLALLSKRYLRRKEAYIFALKLKVLAAYLQIATDPDFAHQWGEIGTDVQQTVEVAPLGASRLLRLGESHRAQQLLERAIKTYGAVPALLDVYVRLPKESAADRLKFLKTYEESLGEQAHYLLVMGSISAQNDVWGIAEQYWKRALQCEESSQVHNALASLYDRLGQAQEAAEHWRRASQLETTLPLVTESKMLPAADVSEDPKHKPDQEGPQTASDAS